MTGYLSQEAPYLVTRAALSSRRDLQPPEAVMQEVSVFLLLLQPQRGKHWEEEDEVNIFTLPLSSPVARSMNLAYAGGEKSALN